MQVRLVATEPFSRWYRALDKVVLRFVDRDLEMLSEMGRNLPPVKAKRLKGVADIMELRIKAGGNQVRIFFAYDPNEDAVLLLGGFRNDRRLYETILEQAKRVWADYVEGLEMKDG